MLKKILILLLLFLSGTSYAGTVSENLIKAAFIFHFIGFTEWNDDQPEYDVCIPDDKSLRDAAQEVFAGKKINDRKVNIVDRREGCHVLVADSAPAVPNILTVGLLSKGALLEFRVRDNKLKFAVNSTRLKNSGLKISSQMLKLAILE